MNTKNREEELGRFLSCILRHRPEIINITLDKQGYADVEELLREMKKHGKKIDQLMLEKIVRENNKQRYSFNENHTKIRANQGHSIKVDLELKPIIPPDILYHGTAAKFLESIYKKGITKQSRQYVHLSKDYKTALEVGKRHGTPVVLFIDAKQMVQDGELFYLSENGVFLCETVKANYILGEK